MPVVQSFTAPAYGQVGSPGPCVVDGKMTGGGFVEDANGVKVNWDIRKMHCPPQLTGPEVKVSWSVGKNPNKTTYEFDTLAFISRVCTDVLG